TANLYLAQLHLSAQGTNPLRGLQTPFIGSAHNSSYWLANNGFFYHLRYNTDENESAGFLLWIFVHHSFTKQIANKAWVTGDACRRGGMLLCFAAAFSDWVTAVVVHNHRQIGYVRRRESAGTFKTYLRKEAKTVCPVLIQK